MPWCFAIAARIASSASSGYRLATGFAATSAARAFGDGPYGFSFELRRIGPAVAARASLAALARASDASSNAAPAVTPRAPTKSRREIGLDMGSLLTYSGHHPPV